MPLEVPRRERRTQYLRTLVASTASSCCSQPPQRDEDGFRAQGCFHFQTGGSFLDSIAAHFVARRAIVASCRGNRLGKVTSMLGKVTSMSGELRSNEGRELDGRVSTETVGAATPWSVKELSL